MHDVGKYHWTASLLDIFVGSSSLYMELICRVCSTLSLCLGFNFGEDGQINNYCAAKDGFKVPRIENTAFI
jgi:hypothetical protein